MSEPRYSLHDFNTIPGYDPTQNGRAERDSWLPLNLADLPDKPPIQPTLGVLNGIGLLYPGKRHIFSGPQESAKTLAAYLLAIQTIRDGGTVVLLDFEMGAYDARARLTDLGASSEDLAGLLYAEPDDPATDDRVGLLIGLSPNLVIIDAAAGAYNIQGLDDNKRTDVEQLTNLYVRSFWRAGIATIMLDHVVKNTETRGAYAIGSERKVGGADVHLGFSVITPISRGHSGLYKITTHKDRGGYLKRGILAEMELRSDPETHEITCQLRPAEEVPEGEVWMPTKQMQKVSELLEQADEPMSRNAIITTLGGSKDYAAKAIDHLVRLKYATETEGPRRAKLVQTSRPFTVYEWEHRPDNTTSPDFPRLPPGGTPTSTSPHPPPFRGEVEPGDVEVPTGDVHFPQPTPALENWSWVDELTPRENGEPPHDLHHQEPT
jgi:hypothetical protein